MRNVVIVENLVKRRLVAALVVVVLGSTGFFAWNGYYKGTPQYALSEIARSIREADRFTFQTHVDLDRLIPAVVDQVLGEAMLRGIQSGDGIAMVGAAIGSGLAEQMKPALVTALRSRVLEAVEDGRIDSIFSPDAAEESPVNLMLFQNEAGTDPTTFAGLGDIERRENVARVGLRFRHEQLDSVLVLHIRMEREGETWRVVAPDDLDRYMREIQALREARLRGLNAEEADRVAEMVDVGPITTIERRLGREHYVIPRVSIVNRTDRPLHHLRVDLIGTSDTARLRPETVGLLAPGDSVLLSAALDRIEDASIVSDIESAPEDLLRHVSLVVDTGAAARRFGPMGSWNEYLARQRPLDEYFAYPDTILGRSSAGPILELTTWRLSEDRDPITDQPRVVLSLLAVEGANAYGTPPVLMVRCQRNQTEVFIAWNDYLGRNSTTVTTRVDDRTPQRLRWSISTTGTATFYPGSAIAFVRSLIGKRRLVAQVTPYNESPVIAVFETEGLGEELGPLRRACNW